MRHQHQRAGIFQQAFFQNFQRWNIKIVRRLVQQQQIGGLKHQLRDQHTRALAAESLPTG